MSTRRIIIISAVVLVILLGILVYMFLSRSTAPTGAVGQTGTLPGVVAGNGALPSVGVSASGTANRLSLVDAGPVAAYFANTSSSSSFGTGTVLVVHTDGTIVSVLNGQETVLSSSSFSNFIAAQFSYDGMKVVVSSGNSANPQVSIFDVATHMWTSLAVGAISPAWSPNDYRLVYLRDNGNGTEALMMFNAQKPKVLPSSLGTFSVQDMALSWPSASDVFLSSRPSAGVGGSIFMFDLVRKSFSLVSRAQSGITAIWNASPLMALAFTAGPVQRGGNLQFIDSAGDTLQNLSFLTLPSKCVFAQGLVMPTSSPAVATSSVATSSATKPSSGNPPAVHYQFISYLYCGVPRDQSGFSYDMLPDAYDQHAVYTSDDMYQIDTTNGHIVTLFSDPSQSFDVANPQVTGSKFYFVNRYDQKLYDVSF